MESRLCVRELPEGEAEYRYYLSCYSAPRKRENRLLGAMAVIGATLGPVALAWLLGGGA